MPTRMKKGNKFGLVQTLPKSRKKAALAFPRQSRTTKQA